VTDPARIEELLIDIEEEFHAFGSVGLYQFSWYQRSPEHRPPPEEVSATARAAYEEFRRRTPTVLVWLPWPSENMADALPADEDTPLNLDLDPNSRVGPYLALIPANPDQTDSR
jgi:hypothetical protein